MIEFEPFKPKNPTMVLTLDDDEFVALMLGAGWSKEAADSELEELKEYRVRFKVGVPEELDLEEEAKGNDLLAAVVRKKRRISNNDSSKTIKN